MQHHHRAVADSYRSAAIFARGDAATWKAEYRFQFSQDADYNKGKPTPETMRCKGAVDALTQFAARMDEKASNALERALPSTPSVSSGAPS